jgi:hypothetical protein
MKTSGRKPGKCASAEFQRFKGEENSRLSLAWNLNRTLSKLNYRIHTGAVKTTDFARGQVRSSRHRLREPLTRNAVLAINAAMIFTYSLASQQRRIHAAGVLR